MGNGGGHPPPLGNSTAESSGSRALVMNWLHHYELALAFGLSPREACAEADARMLGFTSASAMLAKSEEVEQAWMDTLP